MAVPVGVLELQMSADLARLSRDMSQAKGMVSGAARSMESALSGLRTAFGAMGIGLSVGALVAFMRSATDAMDGISKLSQKIGVTVESLSTLRYAAQLSDVSLDQLGTGLKKLSVNMLDMQSGTGEARHAFRALGISVTDSRGALHSSESVMLAVADKFARMEDGAGKTALAVKLFGRAGADLIPFLNQGREGIAALTAEAERLGLKMSTESARAAERFNDNMASLGVAATGAAQAMVTPLLPALNDIADAIKRGAVEGGILKGVLEGLRETAAQTLGWTNRAQLEETNRAIAQTEERLRRAEALRAASNGPEGAAFGRDRGAVERYARDLAKLYEQQRKLQTLAEFDTPGGLNAGNPATGGGAAPGMADEAALKRQQAAAEKHRQMLEKYRELDAASWVKHIEDQIAEYERGLHEQAKATDEFYKEKEKLDKADQQSVFAMIDAEQERAIAAGAIMAAEMTENHKALEAAAAESKRRAELDVAEAKRQQDELGRGLTDALMRGFEGGKDAASNFIDSLKNMFKTLVLRPVLQWVLSPITGAVAGMLPGSASASGGGGFGFGDVLSLGKSGYEALTGNSWVSSLLGGGNAASTASWLSAPVAGMAGGAALALGSTGLGLSAAGTGLGLSAAGGGLGLSAAGVNAAAIGTGALGAGAGIMSTIGMAMPYIGLALAVGSMLGVFGGKKGPKVHEGYGFTGSFDPMTGAVSDYIGEAKYSRDGKKSGPVVLGMEDYYIEQFQKVLQPTFKEFTQIAKTLRLDASGVGASTFSVTTGPNHLDDLKAFPAAAAQLLNEWSEQLIPSIKDLAEENEEYIATLIRVSAQMTLTDTMFEMMGKTSAEAFGQTGIAALEMSNKLVKLIGGLNEASALTQSFYANFYSEAEAHAVNLRMVNKAMTDLGITALPKTRAEFRALVEAQDLTTESGSELFAALLKIAPAFAAVTEAVDAVAASAAAMTAAQDAVTEAQDALRQAYRTQAAELEQTIAKWGAAAKSLREYAATLIGVGSGGMSYSAAAGRFSGVAGRARLGDIDAMGELQSVAETFRAASLANSRTALDYARDVARIRNATNDAASVAERQSSIAEQQLSALTAQVGALITINDSVLSVEQAIANLATAMGAVETLVRNQEEAKRIEEAKLAYASQKRVSDAALASLRGYVSTTGGGEIIRAHENIASGQAFDYQYFLNLSADIVATERRMLQAYMTEFDKALALYKAIPGHSAGLSSVPYDNYLARLHEGEAVLTASEASSWRNGANDALLTELHALRSEVGELRRELSSKVGGVERQARRTADSLERVTSDGNAIQTVAAEA